jgi:hypothetical protein
VKEELGTAGGFMNVFDGLPDPELVLYKVEAWFILSGT